MGMKTPATKAKHTITWWACDGSGTRIRRNRYMNGGDWGWDVTCSCGWDSRSGGMIQERIKEAIVEHRWNAKWNEDHPEMAVPD